MTRLSDEIVLFLEDEGFECSRQTRDGFDIICTHTLVGGNPRVILPLEIAAESVEDAAGFSDRAFGCIRNMESAPVIVTEDRWRRQKAMTQARLLAHLKVFNQAFARNCEVRRIEKSQARDFLEQNHSYGYAACRYHYGMFLKRQTGHLAGSNFIPGTLIAVATFSNARKWVKGDREIRSYEWTRYASLPGLRISGGMGKMLKTFITEVQPDDIMSYADLEWSEGDVYRQIGFTLEECKGPVTFSVDTCTWNRVPIKTDIGRSPVRTEGSLLSDTIRSAAQRSPLSLPSGPDRGTRFFRNFGSNKYRMKLTDYE